MPTNSKNGPMWSFHIINRTDLSHLCIFHGKKLMNQGSIVNDLHFVSIKFQINVCPPKLDAILNVKSFYVPTYRSRIMFHCILSCHKK